MAKRKSKKSEGGEEAAPKHKAGLYTLRRDREQEFRRTITYDNGTAVQMVFNRDTDVDLTQDEVDFLETEIDAGMLVPSNRDEKKRQRLTRDQMKPVEMELPPQEVVEE